MRDVHARRCDIGEPSESRQSTTPTERTEMLRWGTDELVGRGSGLVRDSDALGIIVPLMHYVIPSNTTIPAASAHRGPLSPSMIRFAPWWMVHAALLLVCVARSSIGACPRRAAGLRGRKGWQQPCSRLLNTEQLRSFELCAKRL